MVLRLKKPKFTGQILLSWLSFPLYESICLYNVALGHIFYISQATVMFSASCLQQGVFNRTGSDSR